MSITSANATFLLTIPGVFPAPVQLQGFATDDLSDNEELQSAETQMGVDGLLSGGFVFVPFKQTISLQADSPSVSIFDAWYAASQVALDALSANGIILLPTLNTKWALTKGYLTGYKAIPDAKKLLQPRKFGITWQLVSPAVTG